MGKRDIIVFQETNDNQINAKWLVFKWWLFVNYYFKVLYIKIGVKEGLVVWYFLKARKRILEVEVWAEEFRKTLSMECLLYWCICRDCQSWLVFRYFVVCVDLAILHILHFCHNYLLKKNLNLGLSFFKLCLVSQYFYRIQT